MALNAAERRQRARIAAYAKHAKHDPVAGTAVARAAFLRRFEDEVDPERLLPAPERLRQAQAKMKEHMARLRFQQMKRRRARSAPAPGAG